MGKITDEGADIAPRWITNAFEARCKNCGASIRPGSRVVWLPKKQNVICEHCVDEGNVEEDDVPDDDGTDI